MNMDELICQLLAQVLLLGDILYCSEIGQVNLEEQGKEGRKTPRSIGFRLKKLENTGI